MAELLPIFLDLSGQRVLLLGGKESALEKLHKLAPTGADIKVIARRFNHEFRAAAKCFKNVEISERPWHPSDFDTVRFVVSAVDDATEHERIAATARAARILVNTVDAPKSTDCYFGAQVKRGPLLIAISTQGKFPGLARAFRLWIEDLLPERLGSDIEELAAIRRSSRSILPETTTRMAALKDQLSLWLSDKKISKFSQPNEA